MNARGIVVSLVAVAVCLIAAAPGFAQDQQPAPRSYVAYDLSGNIQECFDFNKKGVVTSLFNGRKGTFQTMDISEYTGTPADSMYWGQIQNLIFFEYDNVTKMQFHGTCEAQSSAAWGFGGSFGSASCGLTTFYRVAGNFRRSSNLSMIQVGPVWGNCIGLFSADEAVVRKGPSKRK